MVYRLAALLVVATTGCATVPQGGAGSYTPPPVAASPAPAPQLQNMGPREVIPATGGIPVLGIPVGGGLYVPVTGGQPIVGIPVSP